MFHLIILFYFISSARIDGLVKREESPEEMTESYVDRDDFMYYRQVTFGKRVKKFGPQEANSRPIVVCYINLSCVLRLQVDLCYTLATLMVIKLLFVCSAICFIVLTAFPDWFVTAE